LFEEPFGIYSLDIKGQGQCQDQDAFLKLFPSIETCFVLAKFLSQRSRLLSSWRRIPQLCYIDWDLFCFGNSHFVL